MWWSDYFRSAAGLHLYVGNGKRARSLTLMMLAVMSFLQMSLKRYYSLWTSQEPAFAVKCCSYLWAPQSQHALNVEVATVLSSTSRLFNCERRMGFAAMVSH